MDSKKRYRGRECSINYFAVQPSNLELVKMIFHEYHFLKCEKEQFWWLQMLFFGFVAAQCWGRPSGFDSQIPRLRNVFKFTILKNLMVLRAPCPIILKTQKENFKLWNVEYYITRYACRWCYVFRLTKYRKC